MLVCLHLDARRRHWNHSFCYLCPPACVCVCVRARARVRARVCARVCAWVSSRMGKTVCGLMGREQNTHGWTGRGRTTEHFVFRQHQDALHPEPLSLNHMLYVLYTLHRPFTLHPKPVIAVLGQNKRVVGEFDLLLFGPCIPPRRAS